MHTAENNLNILGIADVSATIETPRLRIVPLSLPEFTARIAVIVDPDLKAAMEELLERAGDDSPDCFMWYTNREIFRKDNGKLIGSVALMSSPKHDPEHLIEVGYGIDEPYRCNGYMKEALAALCDMVFRGYGNVIDGMIAGTEISNIPSQRVLSACGFVKTDENEDIGLMIWKRLSEYKASI